MQFNFVVSTNTPAVRRWQQLGFEIIGTLPEAFQHAELGLVDAYVMYRFLEPRQNRKRGSSPRTVPMNPAYVL